MSFREEIEKISVTLRQGDGTLGKVLSTAHADKKKLFGTVAARALFTAAAVFFWTRTGESMTITTVLGVVFGLSSLSPLRFLGNQIEFCEYGVRHNKKAYPLSQALNTTWTKSTVFSIFWMPVYLDLGTQHRLNISYIQNAKKAFLVAYQPNVIL